MTSMRFYAAGTDVAAVMDFIFQETDCRVFEAYSEFDRELREFRSREELQAAFSLGDDPRGRGEFVYLMLYSPSSKGAVHFKRIDLAVKGASFRFAMEGWGLMQLLLGGRHEQTVTESRFAHNSPARAAAWERTYRDTLGVASTWDWDALLRVSRRIQYHLRSRLAVAKDGAAPVLPEAFTLLSKQGRVLTPVKRAQGA